jgi:hypothetical protein
MLPFEWLWGCDIESVEGRPMIAMVKRYFLLKNDDDTEWITLGFEGTIRLCFGL